MKNLISIIILLIAVYISSCTTGKNWDETKAENTVNTYEEFLTNNPETEHKDSVLLLILELDWVSVKTKNSIAALDSFQLKYANNKEYTDLIKTLKSTLAWDKVFEENLLDGYRKFIEDYPESQNRYDAKRNIEKIRWNEVKRINKKADFIEFFVDFTFKNYIDSIDVMFELKDFFGYAVSFEFVEKGEFNDSFEIITFNFNPNNELTGFYEGSSEGDYNVGWEGEIRGQFNEKDVVSIEKRMTDFSDVSEFEPEPWSAFDLIFDEESMTFSNEDKTYILVELTRIIK